MQGAVPMGEGVWLYQLTEKGLALELTVKGTKYYKDDDLNCRGLAAGQRFCGTRDSGLGTR